jgi:AcrR family transcriptional regulator
MPRTDARGGPETRARISNVATTLFLERGFDAVTVAEVAREAGVSSVTVFNHFPRKEDLLLDRGGEIIDQVRAAIRNRGSNVDPLDALHALTLRMVDERQGVAGVTAATVPFFRTIAGSPALVARSRELAANLQRVLTEELNRDEAFTGSSSLLAAFVVAGYSTVLVENARRLMSGETPDEVEGDHRTRLETMFHALRNGLQA